MQSANAVSAGSFKFYRYEAEHTLRNIYWKAGVVAGDVNRLMDTAGNFLSANGTNIANCVKDTVVNVGSEVGLNIAAFFSTEDSTLTVEDAKYMLVKGDHIRVPLYDKKRGPFGHFYHHGIYCGDGMVIEYDGRYPSQDLFTIQMNSLESFARGRRIEVDNREPALYSPDEIVARAKSRLGERAYNLYTNNCENFATWCRSGPALVRLTS